MSKPLKILIACGGTGGHLFPGIAVAEALRARGHDAMLLISEKKIDSQASAKYSHLRFERVQAVAKPATTSPKMIPFLLKLWKAIGHSKKLIHEYQPDGLPARFFRSGRLRVSRNSGSQPAFAID